MVTKLRVGCELCRLNDEGLVGILGGSVNSDAGLLTVQTSAHLVVSGTPSHFPALIAVTCLSSLSLS
jgi:hypothetical protein